MRHERMRAALPLGVLEAPSEELERAIRLRPPTVVERSISKAEDKVAAIFNPFDPVIERYLVVAPLVRPVDAEPPLRFQG